jgi:transposase
VHSQFSDVFIIKQLDKLITLYEKQMTDIGKAIEQLLLDDQVLKASIDRLCAIKGLGLLSVATLVAETNGFTGFDNVRQIVSFAGYDVVENHGVARRSGQRVGKTRISKKGNSRIRRILYMPALNAVRFGEPSCAALYKRVYERSHIKMKAYVAVQKKLLTLCFSLWKSGTVYQPNHSPMMSKNELPVKKIGPTSGPTQDQSALAELSCG